MDMRATQTDPVDWDLAAVQLEDLILANRGRGWDEWKQAVLAWHMEALTRARADAWVPGLLGAQGAANEEAFGRFDGRRVRQTIKHLNADNLELRRKLVQATTCMRFYETGAVDAGEQARSILEGLQSHPA